MIPFLGTRRLSVSICCCCSSSRWCTRRCFAPRKPTHSPSPATSSNFTCRTARSWIPSLLHPIPTRPRSRRLSAIRGAGDSAIWTGHYLAAEAFRYSVTRIAGRARQCLARVAGNTVTSRYHRRRRSRAVSGTRRFAVCRCHSGRKRAAMASTRAASSGQAVFLDRKHVAGSIFRRDVRAERGV